MRQAGGVLLFVAVLLSWVNTVSAQGVGVRNGKLRLSDFGLVDVEKTLQFWEHDEKERSEKRLQLHVAAIQSECHIDDVTARKLQVSAKRVLTGRLRVGRKKVAGFLVSSGLVPPDDDDNEIKESVSANNTESDPNTHVLVIEGAAKRGPDVVGFDAQFQCDASSDPFWLRQIEQALTDEQKQSYQDWAQLRHRYHALAVTTRWVTDLDSKAILTTDQRRIVTEHLLASFPERDAFAGPAMPVDLEQHLRKFAGLNGGLDRILTEEQVLHVRSMLAQDRNRSVGFPPQKL